MLLLFLIHGNMNQKIAPRIERKRDSIEFERSDNIGQFLITLAFKDFLNLLNAFG